MYVQWASFPFKFFPSSKRLPREVQKHFQKSLLKSTDKNSDTTKYEQNHIPMWNLNLPWRKGSPRKFDSFELCIRIKPYVSFQWKSHGTKLNMKRRQTAACMFTRMSKIRFFSGVLYLLNFTGVYRSEVCLYLLVTHSVGLAEAKITIGSPVSTDLYRTISYPAREQTILWRVCMDRGMWECVDLKFDRKLPKLCLLSSYLWKVSIKLSQCCPFAVFLAVFNTIGDIGSNVWEI